MDCGCDKKKQTGSPCEACGAYPEYRDSEVLGGDYWPAIGVHPLSLAAGQEMSVNSLSDVRRTMLVNVTSGVAYMWFREMSGRPFVGGDDPHCEFVSGQGPAQVILPPGHWRLMFGAGADLALVACVTLLDRDPHGRND